MKKQIKGKKRIVLSGVAVLTTLALLAGGTMAWFTDTERIGADFQAGVLDIEVSTSTDGPITQDMTFTNLRPMELESFEAELNGTDFEGKAADEIVNPNTDGFDPLPVYFHPVTVTNVGSLPAQVRFTMEDAGPCNGTIANLVDNGFGGVKPGDPAQVDCEDKYNLKDVLKVYVYEKVDDTWQRVPDVNLNAESCEGSEKSYYLPFDSTDPLGANADTMTYVIAGYLPGETTGNAYQAAHYHGKLQVEALQVDALQEDQPSIDVPEDAVRWDGNGHYYKVYGDTEGEQLTWEEAKLACEKMGGHLATVTSPEEQKFIESLDADTVIGEWSVWIGLSEKTNAPKAYKRGTDAPKEYEWVTDEPYVYSNWASSEPSGDGPYVAIRTKKYSYGWNDCQRETAYAYLCEWDVENPPETDPAEDAVYWEGNGHYYKVFDKMLTWEEAKKACEEMGGHLATITSAEEQAFIESLDSTTCIGEWSVWIGLSRPEGTGPWTWITGEPYEYTHWDNNEPSGDGSCVAMRTKNYGYGWNDADANTPFAYVCEWDV